jgi:hypothetical protein
LRGQSNPTTEHSKGKGEAPDQPGEAQADKGRAGTTPSKNQVRRRETLNSAKAEAKKVHFQRRTSQTTTSKGLDNSTRVGEAKEQGPISRQEHRTHRWIARGRVIGFVHGPKGEGSRVRRDTCRDRRAILCGEMGASRDTARVKAGSRGGAHKSKGITRSNSTPITRGSRLSALISKESLFEMQSKMGDRREHRVQQEGPCRQRGSPLISNQGCHKPGSTRPNSKGARLKANARRAQEWQARVAVGGCFKS